MADDDKLTPEEQTAFDLPLLCVSVLALLLALALIVIGKALP